LASGGSWPPGVALMYGAPRNKSSASRRSM
jgi:hypothetical protein